MTRNINFVSKFRKANIFSLIIFILSVIFIFFKGLNYGIDFKGGTLIELRTDTSINAPAIRDSLKSMNLGDINVKKFGKEGDYLIKVEQKNFNNSNLIPEIKKTLADNLNADVDFRTLGDNELGKYKYDYPWQTPATVAHSWGYNSNENKWKSTTSILKSFIASTNIPLFGFLQAQ